MIKSSFEEKPILESVTSISVIIPVFNEEQYLGQLLSSIRSQEYPKDMMEIIVVDNGSSDQSKAIAEKTANKVISLPYATVAGLRNAGAKRASGGLLAFVDADCLADKFWLKNGNRLYQAGYRVFGCAVEIPSDASWIERAWFSQRYAQERRVNYLNSANIFIDKKTFFQAGGFDERLESGEDSELCVRLAKLGGVVWYSPSLRVTHLKNPKNIESFLKRELWHGSEALASLKTKPLDKTLLASVFFILGWVSLLLGILFSRPVCFLALSLLLSIPLLTALYNSIRYKNLRYFFHLLVLYFFYFIGRSMALFIPRSLNVRKWVS